jgi:hypothetical protein
MSAEAQKPIEDDDQEIIIEQEEEVSEDVEETASSAPETEPDDNAEELESYSKGVQTTLRNWSLTVRVCKNASLA